MKRSLSLLALLLCLIASQINAQSISPIAAAVTKEFRKGEVQPINLFSATAAGDLTDVTEVTEFAKHAEFLQINSSRLRLLADKKPGRITLDIPFNGQTYKLDLIRYDIFSDDFKLGTVANNEIEIYDYNKGAYYRGIINGMEHSIAAFSFFGNELYGVFSIPGIGNVNVVPYASSSIPDNGEYILYNDADLLMDPPTCAADQLPVLSSGSETYKRSVYESCREVQMYILADYETYVLNGFDVTTVGNYVTSIFNVMATLYRNEDISLSIKRINVNVAPDIYQNLPSNSNDYLNKFGELTQNELFGADLAHLISSKHQNMGGVAWLDVLCQPYQRYPDDRHPGPYGFSNIHFPSKINAFPQYSWNVQVITHEIGHNLGSHHTHWCGWPGGPIDGCSEVEYGNGVPSCNPPVPRYPSNGGTIMSYCHLQRTIGINFANGFGPLPGDEIRNKVAGSDCLILYPTTALSSANTVVEANRECTDQDGTTYYWNDNNSADEADDILVLQIKKGTNDIGDLNDTNFIVRAVTLQAYGSRQGAPVELDQLTPDLGNQNFAMNRYWSISPSQQPATEVEVQFPFLSQDINDIRGSVLSMDNYRQLLIYTTAPTLDPDPGSGLLGADNNNTAIYTLGNNPSLNNWSYSTNRSTLLASFKTKSLTGGSGFATFFKENSISNVSSTPFRIYPNPTAIELNIQFSRDIGREKAIFKIFDLNGREIHTGTINKNDFKINTENWKTGVYFLEIDLDHAVYTQSFIIGK